MTNRVILTLDISQTNKTIHEFFDLLQELETELSYADISIEKIDFEEKGGKNVEPSNNSR